MSRLRVSAAFLCALTFAGTSDAQIRGPARAQITPLLAADAAHPGTDALAAIDVNLPEG